MKAKKKNPHATDDGRRYAVQWMERGKPRISISHYSRAMAHEWAQILGCRKYKVVLVKPKTKQELDEEARKAIIDEAHKIELLIRQFSKRLKKERRIAVIEIDAAVDVEVYAKRKGNSVVLAMLGPV